MTKRPNFRRISHSGTFPPKRPNQSRRISGKFHTQYVSVETAESMLPNFRPNFALGKIIRSLVLEKPVVSISKTT
ncbi:MAG: hypothetical protein Q8881_03695 [Sweet potato little leaf phytoplasma]|nr:hypothetical protein [Sweet potato little leaf phytoplasma]